MTAVLERPAVPRPRPAEPEPAQHKRGRLARLVKGRPAAPAWHRPSLLGLLLVTAVAYLWNIGVNGYSNDFYAAAVQAGTQSWKAFFFGSLDSANAITVDKPPASLWVMELSGRIFGFSSTSMLAPQALLGVAAVGLTYGTVRRTSNHVAGLFAGAALALTPAASLMFRFNNPDALLVTLLVGAAYCTVRAIENGSTKWLIGAGAAVGFGFITKMGQAFLVLPALGVVYLVLGPLGVWKRVRKLLAAVAVMVASAGWYIAAVELTPASMRPYVGGSTNDSLLELAFGYNGLGRLFGGSGNGGTGGGTARTAATASGATADAAAAQVGGGGGGGGFSGATGITRLFRGDMATEISWLVPAALISLVAGLWITRKRPRTDRTRAGIVLWGLWLVVTGLTFSFAQGTIHEYYTVALAPAVAALVAIGVGLMVRTRSTWFSKGALALTVAVTAAWDIHLLNLYPTFLPVLKYVVGAAAFVAVGAILLMGSAGGAKIKGLATIAVLATVLTGATGGAAFALDNLGKAHTGSIPTSGPSTGSMGGGAGTRGGATPPTGGFGGPGSSTTGASGTGTGTAGTAPTGTAPTGTAGTGASGTRTAPADASGTQTRTGGAGGSGTADASVVALLKAAGTTWAAATVGSQTAAPLELASGTAVMAIGGFTGSDDSPTLAEFQAYVAAGKIHYFISGGGAGGGMGGGSSSEIASWVAANYTATTVGSSTVYDLTA